MKTMKYILSVIAGIYIIYNMYIFGFTKINVAALIIFLMSVAADVSRSRRLKKQLAEQGLAKEKADARRKRTSQLKK